MSTFANETSATQATGQTNARRRWMFEGLAVVVGALTMMVLWIGRRVRRPQAGADQ